MSDAFLLHVISNSNWSVNILPNIVLVAFWARFFFPSQPVGAICDGQTNRAGEVDDVLSGQRRARHAERHGPVSQGDPGITFNMNVPTVARKMCRTSRKIWQSCSHIFILIEAEREAEGAGKQGHSIQSAGWREDQHQSGLRLEEHCCSSAEERAKCNKSQQTTGCGPTLTRSARTKDQFSFLQLQLA